MDTKYYQPAQKDWWTGRTDSTTDRDAFRMHQIIECINLEQDPQPDKDKLNFCILGFCCDEGIERNKGRRGAKKGPMYIRKEFANLPVTFDNKIQIFDAGNIICYNENLEEAQKQLSLAVAQIISLGMFPLVLGGGHEVALGHYNGIVKALAKEKIGIINFDAHFDIRPYENKGSSGTMFAQIADQCKEKNREFNYMVLGIQTYANTISLFKKAAALGTQYVLARDFKENNYLDISAKINNFINRNDKIYLTICSDVFNAAFAPGVSAVQPFGMDPETVLRFIKSIIKSGKVVSMDIAEVSPRFDHDNQTAKLAAVILYSVINTLIETKGLAENLYPVIL